METATPMLRQYQQIKSSNRDFILFFRLGDFYEMFFDDAKIASRVLDLVLTSRGTNKTGKIPMCGVPFHAAEAYIARLVKAGFKVAVCEQVEDPKLSKGIVRRKIVRRITPGTYIPEEDISTGFIATLSKVKNVWGLALLDIQTGVFMANEFSAEEVVEEIARQNISEVVFPEGENETEEILFRPQIKIKSIMKSPREAWRFLKDEAARILKDHFSVASLKGFGFDESDVAVRSAGALLAYVKDMVLESSAHITALRVMQKGKNLYIPASAQYGLGLEDVFKVIDFTGSSIGKRTLRSWMFSPLLDVDLIRRRQDAVEFLLRQSISEDIHKVFYNMTDAQKALSRLACGQGRPRDLLAILQVLERGFKVVDLLGEAKNPLLVLKMSDVKDIYELLKNALNPDIPVQNFAGKVIKAGFNKELDELRSLQSDARSLLKRMQEDEIRKTGISSLKIGYNKVFGYYIEVTKANLNLVPNNYIRKQTLVNAERFITPQLKEFEERILFATERALALEDHLIKSLITAVLNKTPALQESFRRLGNIDSLSALAVFAEKFRCCKPDVDDSFVIDIKAGRHPVVEQYLGGDFVANDILLNNKDASLLLITGPNMAGKSTYIRQAAILVILAQMGAFIPAEYARIGIVDKVFTRIGAQDEIAKGQSTFMVEMSETASILNNATERSLVILDEIGRGTSTYDGLSLAWAVAEALAEKKARTLFATHFHEITVLESQFANVKNYNVSVKEWMDEVVFLHKIIRGAADQSYGIYVAKIAGLPDRIIKRARHLLSVLEMQSASLIQEKLSGREIQLGLFHTENQRPSEEGKKIERIKEQLVEIDINNITPIEAINILAKLKKELD